MLPGTIPSIKAMIVEFIFACEEKGVKQVALQDIYQALEERIKKKSGGTNTKAILLKIALGANSTTIKKIAIQNIALDSLRDCKKVFML